MVEINCSGDPTDDDGHTPAQEVETKDGFGGQGHGNGLRWWCWGLLSLCELLQHITVTSHKYC